MSQGSAELDACAILREGVAELLDATKQSELARAVRSGRVEIAEEREIWEMTIARWTPSGCADRGRPAFVMIRENPVAMARVREAFASAVRSCRDGAGRSRGVLRPTDGVLLASHLPARARLGSPGCKRGKVQRAAAPSRGAASAELVAELLERASWRSQPSATTSSSPAGSYACRATTTCGSTRHEPASEPRALGPPPLRAPAAVWRNRAGSFCPISARAFPA